MVIGAALAGASLIGISGCSSNFRSATAVISVGILFAL